MCITRAQQVRAKADEKRDSATERLSPQRVRAEMGRGSFGRKAFPAPCTTRSGRGSLGSRRLSMLPSRAATSLRSDKFAPKQFGAAVCHRQAFAPLSSGRSILRQTLFGPYPVPVDCCGMCRFKGVAILILSIGRSIKKHSGFRLIEFGPRQFGPQAPFHACYAPEPQHLCAVSGLAQNNLNLRFWSRLSAIEWLPSATERLSPQRVRAEASCAKSFLAHTLFPLTAAECVDSKV